MSLMVAFFLLVVLDQDRTYNKKEDLAICPVSQAAIEERRREIKE